MYQPSEQMKAVPYLVKHYQLESKSEEKVEGLERQLRRYFLNKKQEPVANESSVTNDNLALRMVNLDAADDFDVLYQRKEIKERKGILRRPALVSLDLVVKGSPEEIVEIKGYLAGAGFDIITARMVTEAAYTFITHARTETTADAGIKNWGSLFGDESNLKCSLGKTEGRLAGNYGHNVQGSIKGDVIKVLHAREVICKNGQDLPLYDEGITFA